MVPALYDLNILISNVNTFIVLLLTWYIVNSYRLKWDHTADKQLKTYNKLHYGLIRKKQMSKQCFKSLNDNVDQNSKNCNVLNILFM